VKIKPLFFALLLSAGAVALPGCVTHPHDHGKGPPPHAPAHGYRHKHACGADLVYDAGIGVYVVVGLPGIYFHDDLFYRRVSRGWQASHSLDGPWQVVEVAVVPPHLASNGKHGHGKGHSKHE
jgi:hypothetical protein